MNNQQTFCGWVSSVVVLYSTTLKGQEFSGDDKWRQSMGGVWGVAGVPTLDSSYVIMWRVGDGEAKHTWRDERDDPRLPAPPHQKVRPRSELGRAVFCSRQTFCRRNGVRKKSVSNPFTGKHLNLFNRAALVTTMRRLLLDLPVLCSASATLLLLTGVWSLCRLLNLYDSRQEDREERQTLVTDSLGSVSPSAVNGRAEATALI